MGRKRNGAYSSQCHLNFETIYYFLFELNKHNFPPVASLCRRTLTTNTDVHAAESLHIVTQT